MDIFFIYNKCTLFFNIYEYINIVTLLGIYYIHFLKFSIYCLGTYILSLCNNIHISLWLLV